MPGGDGTGPMGMGPMTGRAAGFCAGYQIPGHMNPMPGRGFQGGGRGFGRGGGRGRRNWYRMTGMPGWQRASMGMPGWGSPPPPPYQPAPETDELEALKAQADYLQSAMEEVRQRIEELQSAKVSKEE